MKSVVGYTIVLWRRSSESSYNLSEIPSRTITEGDYCRWHQLSCDKG